VVGNGPAHHLAARQIDDGGQVGPALPGSDVGDVADVAAVELGTDPEVALDQVLGRLGFGIGDRRRAPALLGPAFEAGLAHEPAHPPLADLDALVSEGLAHPQVPIGALGLVVDLFDPLGQLGIGDVAGRGDGLLALVVGGPGDLEQATGALGAMTCSWVFQLG
jgi:hypothetical protein